jgi:hypothetical protein
MTAFLESALPHQYEIGWIYTQFGAHPRWSRAARYLISG